MSLYGQEAPYGELQYKGDSRGFADFVGRASRLLVEQFEDSEHLHDVVASLMREVQSVEFATGGQDYVLSIPNASNAQLDGIGEIVGISRGGMDDVDYRSMIYYAIMKNSSFGQIEVLAQFVYLSTEQPAYIRERFPACVDVGITSSVGSKANLLIKALRDLSAGGVRINAETYSPDGLVLLFSEPTMLDPLNTGVLLESGYAPSVPLAGRFVEQFE